MSDEKATLDMPLEEAINDLTGFEVLAIEREFGDRMENLGGIRTLMGTIWAYENRDAKRPWADVKAMTMKEMQAYFAKKSPDPESDQQNLSVPVE